MAADKTITINFVPKGDQKLIAAFQGLAKAQKKIKKTTQRVTDSTDKMGNAFSVMRSKLLLFNFAMALGIRQLVGFAKEAAKVKSMETAFTNMSGSVKGAEIRLNALKSATNGTMAEFDLFQQANNAMVLGLTRNTGEMAHMFDAAQRLGRALGRDTKSSIESLVTGIGRQSRLMLDNLGIIVQTEKAYEKYAVSLGKSASALTDTERKQAFFNAAMEAAEQKLLILGDEIPTSQDALDAMAASFNDASINIGKAFLPMLESMASFMSSLAKHFDPETVRAYTAGVVILGGAMAIYVTTLEQAVIWQTRLGWGALITGAGILAGELMKMTGWFEEGTKAVEDARAKTVAYTESLKNMMGLQLEGELRNQTTALETLNAETARAKKEFDFLMIPMSTVTKELLLAEAYMLNLAETEGEGTEAHREARLEVQRLTRQLELLQAPTLNIGDPKEKARISALIAEIIKYQDILGESGLTIETHSEAQEKVNELYNKTPAAVQANIESQIEWVEGLDTSIISVEKQAEVLAMLNLQLNKSTKDEEKLANQKIKNYAKIAGGLANLNTAMKGSMKVTVRLQQVQAMIDAYAGAQSGWAMNKKTYPFPIPELLYAADITVGLAQARALSNSIGDKFEQGGMVGGRRHSSGGTMIEAEQGEYVMSRNAVDAVGVEAMNRINAGGGGGSVNISFAGNVMSQDFIEDEAIPMIKEAIRRGADIGVA